MNANPVDLQQIFEAAPGCFLVFAPDPPRFTILAVTDAFLRATQTQRSDILGLGALEAFPDNPADPATQTLKAARASLQRVMDLRRPDVLGVHKYAIRTPGSKDGGFTERFWSASNHPVLGADGQLACIILRVEDITESEQLKRKGSDQQAANLALRDSRRAALNLLQDAVAARQQAEQANADLRISQERLALAASGTRLGMFDRNIVTGEAFATEQHFHLHGLQTTTPAPAPTPMALSQPYQYRQWAGCVHPEDLPRVEADLRRCQDEHVPYETEYRVIWPDGSVHWLAARGLFQYDAQGQPQHLLGIVLDITERKQAEVALRESEQRLRLAQQAAKIGAFEWNVQTGVNVWTPELEAMYGLAPGEFGRTQSSWEQLVHPEDRARAVGWVNQAFEIGEPVEGEWRVVWRDGSVHWIAGRFQAFKDPAGNPLRLSGVNLDITERKQAEEALRHAVSLLQTTLDSTADGLLVVDATGKIRNFNQRFVQLWRIPESILASRDDEPVLAFVLDQFREPAAFLARVRELYATPKATSADVLEFKDGRVFERYSQPQWLDGQPVGRVWSFRDVTERKQAEESLRRSREDLDRAQQVGQIGSWRLDVQHNVLTWSDENHRIFGVPPGTPLTYETFLAMVHPDDRQYVDTQWEAALHGAPYDIEHRIVTDGQVKWVREKAYLEFDEASKLLGGFGITQDITDRKQAEAALRENERFIQSLAQASPHWLYVFDFDSKGLTYQNRSILRDLGYPPEVLRAASTLDTFRGFMPPEEMPHLARLMEEWQSLPDGRIRDDEYCLRGADGKLRHFAGRETVFTRRADGTVQQVLGLLLDITGRKQTEEALRQSEASFGGIVSSAMDAIISVDEQQRIRLFNAAAETMFGMSAGQARGQPLHRLIPKHFRTAHREHVHDFAKTGVTARRMGVLGEISGLRANGEEFPIEASISQIEVAGQKVFTVILRDITERKRAEKELNELNATLERRVADRTEALTDANERLNAIMDSALVGILTLDERGIVQELNPMVAQIFGYPPDKIVGHNISRLLASSDQVQAEEFLAHYLRAGELPIGGGSREILGRHQDGHGIVLEVTMNEFVHADTRLFVAMLRDITGRKRLEREILEVGERERQRIGHDLHDGLGQHLHALYYMAGLLQQELKGESPARAREAGRLSKLLSKALDLSRSLAHGLQPVNPVPEGLMLTLRELARRTRALYRVDCQFDCHAPVLIHRHSAATHLYRIAQEAVNNAMKHGKPTRIRIQLKTTRQQIILGVRDNGAGIRRQTKHHRGMGLHIMQYRADAIGGSLAIRRHPRGGTEAVCTVPREALLRGENEIK